MTFEEAYALMLKGKKIKRPDMKGFWFIDTEGKFSIQLGDGKVITGGSFGSTVRNVLAEDWMLAE